MVELLEIESSATTSEGGEGQVMRVTLHVCNDSLPVLLPSRHTTDVHFGHSTRLRILAGVELQ